MTSQTDSVHLWEHLSVQPVQFTKMLNCQRLLKGRLARHLCSLKACSCAVPSVEQARPVGVYAVYAQETDPPEGEEAVGWMLLNNQPVTNAVQAATILRWYTWHEYHKVLKSAAKLKVIG